MPLFLAALVNYAVGARYGWRAVFAVGGAPALLVAFIRAGVTEPKRWHRTKTAYQAFCEIFSPEYRKRTIVNTMLLLCSMIGLWAVRQQPTPYADLVQIDGAMLLSTFVLAIASSLAAGVLPAWRACLVSPGLELKGE